MKKVMSTAWRKFPFPVPINVNGGDPCEKDQEKNDERETVLKGDVQSKHLTSNAQRSTSNLKTTNREQSWGDRGSRATDQLLILAGRRGAQGRRSADRSGAYRAE